MRELKGKRLASACLLLAAAAGALTLAPALLPAPARADDSYFAGVDSVGDDSPPPRATQSEDSEDVNEVELTDSEFRGKLDALLSKLDKSISLTREQVSANPGAPFLPDLFMQLGELLSQKADTLYYLETERRKKISGSGGSDSAPEDASRSDQVVRAVQEAGQVFQMIDHDYPNYAKRPKVLLMGAAAHKMLHENAAFKISAEKLFQEFPASLEAAKARLLLAEMYFDIEGYDECLQILEPLFTSPFPYERNAAKYKSALVYLLQEKFRKSLDRLAEVAKDPELEPLGKKNKGDGQDILQGGGRLDLKREALKDSIRAYTQLYPKGQLDPVPYYSDLSPSEVYFQEVIENLAYRYILLKEIRTGVRLLRVLCERLRKPQRVVRIYVDVFSKLTPEERSGIEPSEVAYVLEDLKAWLTFYTLEPALHNKLEDFFEKQVRELGTGAHDRAKKMAAGPAKTQSLERAIGFYDLYLGHFKSTKFRVKMAMNLADAEYLAKSYRACGETYLKVFQNEYGPREQAEKVIQSAIVCLQSEKTEDFYSAVRARGLLIHAIRSYLTFRPRSANDPKIGFALIKAQYEQGSYGAALEGLYAFMQKFRSSPQAVSAGELVLDYYNTRSDLQGLKSAAERILTLGITDAAFTSRLQTMRKQVALKRLYQRVDSATASSDSSRGESYLSAALSSGDDSIKNVALQQALASSRSEGNVEVYLKTAAVLMAKEKNATTRAQLTVALASENLKLTRFYRALGLFKKVASDRAAPSADRDRAWDQAVNIAVTLRDPSEVVRLMEESRSNHDFARTSADIKNRASTFLTELMDGPERLPDSAIPVILERLPNDDVRVSVYKLQPLMGAAERKRAIKAIDAACEGGGSKGIACAWQKIGQVEEPLAQYLNELRTTTAGVDGLDPIAKKLENITTQYSLLEGAGDPQLDMVRLIRLKEVYSAFAAFLNRLAKKNPDLKTLLQQKAAEAQASAAKQQSACQSAGIQLSSAGLTAPATRFCSATQLSTFASLLHVPLSGDIAWQRGADPTTSGLEALEKKRFVNPKEGSVMLALASAYLSSGHPNHAIASALLGAVSFPEHEGDFEAVSTCATRSLGLPRESSYHLKKASDYSGLKKRCPSGSSRAASDVPADIPGEGDSQ